MRHLGPGIVLFLALSVPSSVEGQAPPGCPPPAQIAISWSGRHCGSWNGIPCNVGEPIRFRAVLIPEGAFCHDFVWDFGDSISTNVAPTHTFRTDGHHRVTLRASDDRRYSVVSGVVFVEGVWCGCNTGRGEVVAFRATPSIVTRGEPVVLTWTTVGASRVRINPLSIEFPVDPPFSRQSGSHTFVPKETGRYTITAYSFAANGLAAPVTVTVQDPPARRRRVRK